MSFKSSLTQILTTIAAVVLAKTAFAGPIHGAASGGDLAGVQAELDKGVDVNAKNEDGFTPLHQAAFGGHKEVAELLIAEGADVNAKNTVGMTALHWAVHDGYKEIAELLIANGADVNMKDGGGFTPLDEAEVVYGWHTLEDKAVKRETAALLRKHGGISGVADSIHVAAALENIEAVKQHLATGKDVNAPDGSGMTPLLYAVAIGNKTIVELLIANGADVNAKDDYGWTPLIHAVDIGNNEIVELLIAEGADVNMKVDGMVDGSTLLHETTYFGTYNKEIAELLIAAGADVNAKDGEGSTPLDNLVDMVEWWMMAEVWGGDSIGEEAWSRAIELTDFLRKHGGKTSEELSMPHLMQHGRFVFSFDAEEGKVYEVQDSFDLLNWEVIKTYTGTGSSVRFDEERDHDPPKIFYRVKVVE